VKGIARRAVVLTVALGAVVGLALAQTGKISPRLIYNASASAPRGFYLVHEPGLLRRGDLVLARLPPAWQAWAAGRGYLGENVPVIKRIAALAGDYACARGSALLLNGRIIAAALERDSQGRKLPRWRGCRRLEAGEVLLLIARQSASFDGRYFGPLTIDHVVGRLRPLGHPRRARPVIGKSPEANWALLLISPPL
jgi:conjugative transfer signal peptidase TraF